MALATYSLISLTGRYVAGQLMHCGLGPLSCARSATATPAIATAPAIAPTNADFTTVIALSFQGGLKTALYVCRAGFYGIIRRMDLSFEQLPWLAPLLRVVATVARASRPGRLFNRFLSRHLAHLASGSHGPWDDIVINELRWYIPLWSVLVGFRISLAYWPIPEHWLHLASIAISVVGFASVTFAV